MPVCRGAILRWYWVAVVVGFAVPPCPALADNPDLLRQQLDAGEFTGAVEQAQKFADPTARDAALGQVARAQAAAGAGGASLATASFLSDDLRRQALLDDIRREPIGGQGGGVQPDFNSLIELLTSTIAPQTWSDVGGAGAVKQFTGGVHVDAEGAMRRAERQPIDPVRADELALLREQAPKVTASGDPRRESSMRKISLPRLERAVQLRLAAGHSPDEDMQLLAGLERVEYIFVYPETRDLVIAGPAGAWQTDAEGRPASIRSGRPVVQLDDLVLMLRHVLLSDDGRFGCSIDPTTERLAATQAYLDESRNRPLKPGQREAWLEGLRSRLGAQQISVRGIDPHSRAARVLVEADYRMKLVGIGLEPGTLEVPSYLAMIRVAPGQAPPPLSVLRWWFTLSDDALVADTQRQAFTIRGPSVQVLGENEFISQQGERTASGKADELNAEFAHNFTKHFAALTEKYPIYAELQNIFDLALVAALVKHEHAADRIGWHLTCFGRGGAFPFATGAAPATVETVINHRVINGRHIVAAVSGGVVADPAASLGRLPEDRSGRASSRWQSAAPTNDVADRWWWD
ncbi:MAG TPA: DUF1598 domain-containing protein [Pirellulales bacterium]|jgi:hypothetical protein|nr:DUF1598 domain-containing protein [Pirellulales bacterium]